MFVFDVEMDDRRLFHASSLELNSVFKFSVEYEKHIANEVVISCPSGIGWQ